MIRLYINKIRKQNPKIMHITISYPFNKVHFVFFIFIYLFIYLFIFCITFSNLNISASLEKALVYKRSQECFII